ncbi:cuticular protein RR-2 family member 4 precursor [Nasonia vitripennis]|uniref:Uncharacterized protein n=1 Tax=Nasonia vitripennis TaxID=7425 RepID=A0A7M6W8H1_NASVI|nr:cuticular protein RR-2 family member 4 precursor [Nasonia vitripennis]
MAFKFIAFAALVACANAGAISSAAYSAGISHAAPLAYNSHAAPLTYSSHAAPLAYSNHAAPLAYSSHAAPLAIHAAPLAIHHAEEDHYDPHPQYNFAYNVHDSHTGDVKSQHEERDGDVVKGSYSLVDPDGTKRTVEYTADSHNGFNAVVHKEPLHHHVAVKTVAPVAYHAAPVAHYAQAHHHEPLAYAGHAGYSYHH